MACGFVQSGRCLRGIDTDGLSQHTFTTFLLGDGSITPTEVASSHYRTLVIPVRQQEHISVEGQRKVFEFMFFRSGLRVPRSGAIDQNFLREVSKLPQKRLFD